MPVDLATLAIKVDAVGGEAAAASLDRVAAAATRAEIAANRLAISQNRLIVSQNAVAQSAARAQAAVSMGERAHTMAATATIQNELAALRLARASAAAGAAGTAMGNTFRTVTRDMSAGFVTLNQGIAGLPYALSRVSGPMMLLGIAGIAAVAGITIALKKGISTVDDFQISIISIASSLTNMAKPGQGSFAELFIRNKQYAVEMYRAITLEAVKHFATANQMMTVYNKLVQSGYAVRLDEVKALGVLTDVIKIKTKGQDVERQLNTEIMALMQGQARAGSLLAQELNTRLGPGWKDLVNQHKAAGDLLQWMASLYPGIVAANMDIMNTVDSQWASTKSIVELMTIGGMQDAYKDVVGFLKDINNYLYDNESIISQRIHNAWSAVKELVEGVLGVVRAIYNIVAVPVKWTIEIVGIVGAGAKFLASGGGEYGSFGFGDMTTPVGKPRMSAFGGSSGRGPITYPWQTEQLRRGLGTSDFVMAPWGITIGQPGGGAPPKVEATGAGQGKGGKAVENAQKQLENFINSMEKAADTAGKHVWSMLEDWYNKQVLTLQRIEKVVGYSDIAHEKLEAARSAKQKKLLDDMEAANTKAMEKFAKEQMKNWTDSLNIQKDIYSQMADTSPLLEDQVAWKRKALDIELQISRTAFEEKLAAAEKSKWISKAQADELRGWEAIASAQKKYNAEMENRKDIYGWAWKRFKEDQSKNTIADLMEGTESFVTDVFSQGIQGALAKTKPDFMEVAKTMAQSLVMNLAKQGIHKAFSTLAEGILGDKDKAKILGASANNAMWVQFEGQSQLTGGGGFGRIAERVEKTAFAIPGIGKGGKNVEDAFSFMDQYSWKDYSKEEQMFGKKYEKDIKDWLKGDKELSKGMGGLIKLQDQWMEGNQKAFQTTYLDQYTADVSNTATSMVSIWGAAQQAMTLAGASGEAQRYGTMVAYGIQAISFIYDMVAKGTLAKAWAAGASAYSSVWETVGFPVAVVLAPIMAAVAFAGTMAAATMGGGGGGGISPGSYNSSLMPSSAGGDYQVAATGIRKIHEDETILPAWAAQGWRNIVSRETSGKGSGGGGLSIGAIHIDARGASKDIDWKAVVKKQIAPEIKKLAKMNRIRI